MKITELKKLIKESVEEVVCEQETISAHDRRLKNDAYFDMKKIFGSVLPGLEEELNYGVYLLNKHMLNGNIDKEAAKRVITALNQAKDSLERAEVDKVFLVIE